MLRSKSLFSMIATGVALLAPLAMPLSAAGADMKIGIVNFGKLAEESAQAKAVQAALEREFGSRQRELMQQQKDLQAKEEKLKRDAAVMSEAERNKAQRELVDGQRDAVRRQNEFKEDVELRRNEELGKLENSLKQEVMAYAKAQGFDVVLYSNAVLYRKDSIDITSQIAAASQEKTKGAAPAGKQ